MWNFVPWWWQLMHKHSSISCCLQVYAKELSLSSVYEGVLSILLNSLTLWVRGSRVPHSSKAQSHPVWVLLDWFTGLVTFNAAYMTMLKTALSANCWVSVLSFGGDTHPPHCCISHEISNIYFWSLKVPYNINLNFHCWSIKNCSNGLDSHHAICRQRSVNFPIVQKTRR